MKNRTLLIAVMAGTLGACSFHAQELKPSCDTNDGLGPCGEGETCFTQNAEATCLCGVTMVTGASVCSGDAICSSDDRCNAPPVAVIGDGSDVIEVGAQLSVTLSSSESYDPDGDLLGFSWSISGDCLGWQEELGLPTLRFWTLAAGTTCIVSLTAEDGLTNHTTTVEVHVVDVGSYVDGGKPDCAALGDLPTFIGKGTQTNPWCELNAGIRAAKAYSITEVLVAEGVYDEPGIVIPAAVIVRGGLEPANGWAVGSIGRSELALVSRTAIQVDPRGVTLGGDNAVLESFFVYRVAACTGNCAIVTARGVSAQVWGCILGNDSGNTYITDADGHEARVIDVDSGRSDVRVTLVDNEIHLAVAASASYGIVLDGSGGNLAGSIAGQWIYFWNASANVAMIDEVVGIRLLNTRNVDISNSTVELYQVTASIVAGVLDGAADAVTLAACGGQSVCKGSRNLTLRTVTVSVNAGSMATRAVGVAFFDTKSSSLTIDGDVSQWAWIEASAAELAVGVWTAGTDELRIDGQNVRWSLRGELLPAFGVEGKLAAGFLDGIPEASLDTGLVFSNSSTRLFVGSADMQAYYTGSVTTGENSSAVAAGALLLGSTQSELYDDRFATGASGLAMVEAGLWTIATQDLLVTGSRMIDYAYIASDRVAAAHIDGYLQAPYTPRPDLGSKRLTMQGNHWATSLRTEESFFSIGQITACQIFIGTSDSVIGGRDLASRNTVNCIKTSGGSNQLVQIWTVATDNLSIIGNWVGPGDVPASTEPGYTSDWIGVRDGHALIEEAGNMDVGSSGLLIDANRIYGPFDTAAERFIGVWIDRRQTTTQVGDVWLKNNAILGTAEIWSIGIRIDYAPVEVLNNTIQAAWCNDRGTLACLNPDEAIGLQAAGGSDFPIVVAGNLFAADAGTMAFLVIDRDADPNAAVPLPSFEVFAGNILNHRVNTSTADQYRYYCMGGIPTVPGVGNSTCYTLNTPNIGALLAGFSDANAVFESKTATVFLCASDGYHLATTNGEAENWGYAPYRPAFDIDGDPRDGVDHDAGADEIDGMTACPL